MEAIYFCKNILPIFKNSLEKMNVYFSFSEDLSVEDYIFFFPDIIESCLDAKEALNFMIEINSEVVGVFSAKSIEAKNIEEAIGIEEDRL